MEAFINEPLYSFLFLLIGCICLLLEVFIPSGGILGFLAVFSSGWGIFGFFAQGSFVLGAGSTVGFLAYASGMFYLILKRLTFKGVITPEASSSVDERLLVEDLVGEEGVTVAPLRPAGMALFKDKKVDVVSVGDFIEMDQRVKVVEISGNRVVVRAI